MKIHPAYLNGQFVPGRDAVDVHNPATGEAFARMSMLARGEVNQAIRDASVAFEACRPMTGKARGEWLNRIADQVDGRRCENATDLQMDNCKPLTQST